MASMNSKNDRPAWPNLSEAEIDHIVIAQADEDSAWEDAIEVQQKPTINNTKTENNAHQRQLNPNCPTQFNPHIQPQ
ncbi:MAG TPA: hypothetical protein IGS52_14170 [Oscillatoriaceae cyanobacterium M33_DOE_052]|uniref:Uncharacterized protein n=1 Tax=Planktothricoides sp. SpSt-374 TaxID=2282167 RepID=A0A7C3ZKP3_9CYAN|nr:hypothetical protein [Oscillatoriaceae cyanobacterium M33_DOE_052]